MTAVQPPLLTNPVGPTILIGFEPDLGVFGGFDLRFHSQFTAGSPSVQINIRVLHAALQNGLAFGRKENQEVTVGIRPDQFLAYVRNSTELHSQGKHRPTFDALDVVATGDMTMGDFQSRLTPKRRRIVQEVSRLSRSARFRQAVLDAYGHRCAVTRFQLRLVEAAHILPVAAPGSADTVGNGVALSPTLHRAFDQGLIFLDESLNMRLNPRKEQELVKLARDAGLESFRSLLGKIHLPADRRQYPDVEFIRQANRFRLIAQ